MKLKITLILLLLQQLACAQSVNLRKLVLNSDLILYLEMADYQYTSLPVNDHFSKDFVKITRVEKVLKNRQHQIPQQRNPGAEGGKRLF